MFLRIFLACLILTSLGCKSNAEQTSGNEIKLPEASHEGKVSVEEAIYRRKSVRSYTDEAITLKEASQILWAAGGETVDGITGPTRAYPSAGATYPLEIYLVAGNVLGLEAGVYRYDWKKHSLTQIKKGDQRSDLMKACYGQGMILQAPATVVVTAVYERTARRYGKRGETLYVPMDAGHMGENVHLMAEALGLGTVMVGAFTPEEVAKVLDIKEENPVYVMPIGRPR